MSVKELSFKKLNPKEALDLAKALCRDDRKRLEDVIERLGGVDPSVIEILFEPQGRFSSMVSQEKSSGRGVSWLLDRFSDEMLLDLFDQTEPESMKMYRFTEALSVCWPHSDRLLDRLMELALQSGSPSANLNLALAMSYMATHAKKPEGGGSRAGGNDEKVRRWGALKERALRCALSVDDSIFAQWAQILKEIPTAKPLVDQAQAFREARALAEGSRPSAESAKRLAL